MLLRQMRKRAYVNVGDSDSMNNDKNWSYNRSKRISF